MTLPRPARRLALLVHVLTSAGWFGMAAMMVVLVVTAGTTTDGTVSTGLVRALRVCVNVTLVTGVLSLGSGLVLGLGTRWGLVSHWWVAIKLVSSILLVGTDLLVVRRVLANVEVGVTATTKAYDPLIAHLVVLTAATALSIYKPWGLTPWARRSRAARTST